MTQADVVEVIGFLFGAYASGYFCGAVFKIFNQFIEKI